MRRLFTLGLVLISVVAFVEGPSCAQTVEHQANPSRLDAGVQAAVDAGEGAETSKEATDDPAKDANEQAEGTAAGETSKSEPRVVTVVSLGLAGSLAEGVSPPGLFGELQPNLAQVIGRLDQAAEDSDVGAVILRLRGPSLGRGKLNELRSAILRLRQSGKPVYADLHFATSADYLLASACDRIVMPESGTLLLPGVRAELTFYKKLFDKLGLRADMLQVGDFKGAAEPYTRTEMSDAFRRQYDLVLDDFFDQMVDTIATDRQLNRDEVKAAIDQGLFTAQQAVDAKLIDVACYEDEYRRELAKQLDADSLRIVRDYGKQKVDTDFSGMTGMFKFIELLTGGSSRSRATEQKKIAVVYAVGPIMTGTSQSDLFGSQTLGSETLVRALQTAESDKTIAAIVLRIDSPGGSALASDLIWRQVKQCTKPVVASMGDVAASGGYYIAMGCDKIVAEPGTLTGSIGVVGGKIALGGLMEKVGLTTDIISRGKNSGIFSSTEPFSDSERDTFRRSMETIYEQFTSKAAEGRGMDLERLKSLAGGRVWTGRQAKRQGLIDELGTLDDAVELARKLANIPSDEETERLILPKPKSFIEQLLEGPDVQVRTPSMATQIMRMAGDDARDVAHVIELFNEPFLLWLPYRVQIR